VTFEEKRPGGALITASDLTTENRGVGSPFLLAFEVISTQQGLTGVFESYG
jgi:hypothetical protein